jgi:hypothetical protein
MLIELLADLQQVVRIMAIPLADCAQQIARRR